MAQPGLSAAIPYYGQAPSSTATTIDEALVAKIAAPVMAMYGGNDARIGETIPPTEAAMKKLNKSYDKHIFEGAGHGFMGNQAGSGGANLACQRVCCKVVRRAEMPRAPLSSAFERRVGASLKASDTSPSGCPATLRARHRCPSAPA